MLFHAFAGLYNHRKPTKFDLRKTPLRLTKHVLLKKEVGTVIDYVRTGQSSII